jgi:hypothetical protein
MKRQVALVLVFLATVLALVGQASAADPDAPPGATPDWLPSVEWVMQRWTPFDEMRLFAELHVTETQTFVWLDSGRGSLADLTRKKRHNPQQLSAALSTQWRPPAGANFSTRTRRARAWQVFTNPHLAEHMLFHNFHSWTILQDAPEIFGVPSTTKFDALFVCMHWSPAEIATHYGRSLKSMRQRTLAALAATAQKGVQIGAMPRGEAKYETTRQRQNFTAQFLNTHTGGMKSLPMGASGSLGACAAMP